MYDFERSAFLGQQADIIESFFEKHTISCLFDSLCFTDFIRLNILSYFFGLDNSTEGQKPINRCIVPLCLLSNTCLKSRDFDFLEKFNIMN